MNWALLLILMALAGTEQPVVLRFDGLTAPESSEAPAPEPGQPLAPSPVVGDVDDEALLVTVERVRTLQTRREALVGAKVQLLPGRTEARSNPARTSDGALEALAQDPGMRGIAVESLVLQEAAPAPAYALLSEEQDLIELPTATLESLLALPAHELQNHLLAALVTGSPDYIESVGASAHHFKEKLEQSLRSTLEDNSLSGPNRAAAAYLLGRMGSRDAVPALKALIWDRDGLIGEAAATALWRMNDITLHKTWEELLRHPAVPMRAIGIQGLAQLKTDAGADHILLMAAGGIGTPLGMQTMATDLLATLPPAMAIPRLISVMRRNFSLRNRAWKILMHLTGEPIPEVPSEWENWYQAMTTPVEPPPLLPSPLGVTPPPSDLLGEVEFVPPPLR